MLERAAGAPARVAARQGGQRWRDEPRAEPLCARATPALHLPPRHPPASPSQPPTVLPTPPTPPRPAQGQVNIVEAAAKKRAAAAKKVKALA